MDNFDTHDATGSSATSDPHSESGPASPLKISARFGLESMRRRLQTGAPCDVLVGRDGRFSLERRLGAGGMGDVYLAHDAVLERHVALKVISARFQHSRSLRRRLLREARALAQVRHPNVLEIYDIDASDSNELFLTMAYIPGQTLGVWQRGQGLRSVVSAYISAGYGLVAAHEQGIVHRDFKPGNVLVDDRTGQVFVSDFGLAGTADNEDVRTDHPIAMSDDDERTSRASVVAGTAPYMAPELFTGQPASFASDQYSYCVALWEGVAGNRPFAGRREIDRPVPARPTSMPPWLYRAVRRGLAADPGARFSSVATVLAALDRGLQRRRRVVVTAVMLTTLAVVVALGMRQRLLVEVPTCASTVAVMDELWDDEARGRVERALTQSDADELWVQGYALPVLDASAEHWRRASVSSCEAHQRAPLSYRAISQRACLDGRLQFFARTLASLERLGARSGPYIVDLLAPLSRPTEHCQLPAPLLHEVAREQLAAAQLTELSRDYDGALALAAEVVTGGDLGESCAAGDNFGIERGEALYRMAHVHGRRESPAEALDNLGAAAVQANGCDHDELLARTYVLQAQVLALDLEQADAAERSLDSGVARYLALGGYGAQAQEIYKARAFIALARSDMPEAISWYETGIEALGDELAVGPAKANLLIDLGAAKQEIGEYVDAERAYTRAVELVTRALGTDHPESRARRAQVAFNTGLMALEQGDEVGARAVLDELSNLDEPALAIKVRLAVLAIIAGDKQRAADATREARSLAAALEQADYLPPRTQAEALTVVGQVLSASADPGGLILLQRALVLWESLPNSGFNRDVCQLHYAWGLADAGRVDAAKQQLMAVLARFDANTDAQLWTDAQELAEQLSFDLPVVPP